MIGALPRTRHAGFDWRHMLGLAWRITPVAAALDLDKEVD